MTPIVPGTAEAAQITANTKDALAAKGMLRHENVATTQAHYVKDVPENTVNAMQDIEARTKALVAKRREGSDANQTMH